MPVLSEKQACFARIPPALALASGLFVSRSRAQSRLGSTISCLATFNAAEGRYGFHGTSQLGSDDLRVVQAIFVLASQPDPQIALAIRAPTGALGQQLANGLNADSDMTVTPRAKIITTAIQRLAEMAGYTSVAGGSRTSVVEALERLAQIRVSCTTKSGSNLTTNLIAKSVLNSAQDDIGEPLDTLAIAIAPVFSEALLSNQASRFVRIGADEIQTLGRMKANGARARVLHMRLCGFIDPGKTRQVSVEKLACYLYGETSDVNTRRRQCADVRRTVPCLEGIGWTVKGDARQGGKALYRITRPALPL